MNLSLFVSIIMNICYRKTDSNVKPEKEHETSDINFTKENNNFFGT